MTMATVVAFKLRLPEALHARIKESADQSSNSVNSEIVRRLGMSFKMDTLREGLLEVERQRDATQARCNQLTDVLLQMTTKVRVPSEEPK
jgi:hypothetical protein